MIKASDLTRSPAKKRPLRIDGILELFSRNPCGDSAGGFEQNNTCAKGGSAVVSQSHHETIKSLISPHSPANESLSRASKIARKFLPNIEIKTDGAAILKNPGVVAAFLYKKDRTLIAFNQNSDYWKNSEARAKQLHEIGYTSTSHKNHAIIHEIGHARHFGKLGLEDYNEVRDRPINKSIASKVSVYATKNGSEFVAEVYAGLMTGKTFDKDVMDYYNEMNGPVVEQSDRYLVEKFQSFSIMEFFTRNPCGDGQGGFEKGNTCAKGKNSRSESIDKYINPVKHQIEVPVKSVPLPGQAAPAIYFPGNPKSGDKPKIFLNTDSDYWDSPEEQIGKCFEIGFSSTNNKHHVIFHEYSHFLHHENLGDSEFHRLKNIKPSELSGKDDSYFENNISTYSSHNCLEFVAEVYCVLRLTNKKLPDDILTLYDKIKGPKVSQELEKFSRNLCGDSSGGFEKGNTCQKGGSGSNSGNFSEEQSKSLTDRVNIKSKEYVNKNGLPDSDIEKFSKNVIKNINDAINTVKKIDPEVKASVGLFAGNETRQRFDEEGRYTLGTFEDYQNTIYFNQNMIEAWNNPSKEMAKLNGIGYYANASKHAIPFHEAAHALHFKSVGWKKFQMMGWEELKNEYIDEIKNSISVYATKSPNEFVAETFVAISSGKPVSDKLLKYYKELGGPEVTDHHKNLFKSLSEEYIEKFSRNPCGDSSGGFEKDNTCQKGGSGSHEPRFGESKASVSSGNYKGPQDFEEHIGNNKFSKNFNRQSLASLAGATHDAEVTVYREEKHNEIIIKVKSNKPSYWCIRNLEVDENGDKYINNKGFAIKNKEDRGKGLGLEVFGRQVEEAVKHGFKYIETYAARSGEDDAGGHEIGYYVWPLYGYDAFLRGETKSRLPESLAHAKKLSDLYATDEGREWWKENGIEMSMRFDLTEGSKSLDVWNRYLSKRIEKGWKPSGEVEKFSIQSLLELFSRNPCGDSSGGFERGNTCQKGGHAQTVNSLVKSAVKSKPPTNPQAARKAGNSVQSAANAGPPLPGQSDQPAKPAETINNLTSKTETVNNGHVPPKQGQLTEKQRIALETYKPVTKQMQADAKKREQEVAAAVGGSWLSNNEPADLVKESGKRRLGIDVKTFFHNTNGQISTNPLSVFNKVKQIKSKGMESFHTVVIDHNTGDIYYKRGYGRYRLEGMHKVKDYLELESLIVRSGSQLPAKAKAPTNTDYYKALTDPEVFEKLKVKAEIEKSYQDWKLAKSRLKKLESGENPDDAAIMKAKTLVERAQRHMEGLKSGKEAS